jgi:hypothetical protein
MTVTTVQRWRDRRDYHLPAFDWLFRPEHHEVLPLPDDTTARAFVLRHHYARSYPAARFRFGLYHRDGGLVGVAVFSHPCSDRVLTGVFPGDARASVELGRFVLLDEVGANGETWFVARCFAALRRRGLVGVLSHSDPVPRADITGRVVFPGHIGTIYQAGNGRYLGRTRPRTLRLLPDATVFSERNISKLRSRDQGWRYAAQTLVAAAAQLDLRDVTLPDPDVRPEQLRRWADQVLARVTRPLRHAGNHRYAWALDRRIRAHLPAGKAYPKTLLAA